MTSSEIFSSLTMHVMQAHSDITREYGDTEGVRAEFFLTLASCCFGALATFATDDSVRTAAAIAAERGIASAQAARQETPKQEPLQ